MSLAQLSSGPPTPEPLPALTKEQEARMIAIARARMREPRPPILLNPPVPGLVSKNPRATMEAIWPRRMPPPRVVERREPPYAVVNGSRPPVMASTRQAGVYYPRMSAGSHGYAPADMAAQRQYIFSITTAKILRHTARDLGYQIVPDGFVRVSEIVSCLSRFVHFFLSFRWLPN